MEKKERQGLGLRYRLAGIAAVSTAFVLLTANPAFAVPPDAAASPDHEQTGYIAGELGFGQVDEDYFLSPRLDLGLELPVVALACADDLEPPCLTRFRFGVQVPLRFRVIDAEPETDAVLREEDWDQLSDYFRILRYVEYGRSHEPLHARFGELGAVVVGHGTIMNGYYNVVTSDTYQFGVHANFNTMYGGTELILDNVVDPSLLGGRAYVRPWGFIDPESWLHRIAAGVSVLSDVDAPERLQADPDGGVVVGPDDHPAVTESEDATVLGFDLEANLIEGEMVGVTPYSDLNFLVGQGAGWHFGTLLRFTPTESALRLSSRLEFRWIGEGYLPDYFGPIYEIDRFQFTGWGQSLPAPKLRVAASRDSGPVAGGYGSVTAQVLGMVSGSVAYSDSAGPDNGALWLRLSITPPLPVQIGAFYYKQNFSDIGEAFDLDGALAITEARVGIVGPLYMVGQYSRLWRLHDDGRYETVDDWNIGAGVRFEF